MSLSNTNLTLTTAVYRDTFETAVTKNVITVVLCISINYINGTLVHTFRKHQIFNMNARYILYIHLVINDIIMLTIFTLIQVLSYIVFTLNVSLCMVLLTIAIFSNLNNPLTLAVMAAECYIAICFPLRHKQICTVKKAYAAIGLIWAIRSLSLLPDIFVTLATEPLDFFRSRVFCFRDNIFRYPHLLESRDISNAVFLVVVWLTLFYTYFRILFAAQAAAADGKKARNTVLLHGFQLMLCMLSYVFNPIIEGLTYFFPKNVPTIRFVVAVFVQILPRIISPVVYGLRDKTFRKYLRTHLLCTTNANNQPRKTLKRPLQRCCC